MWKHKINKIPGYPIVTRGIVYASRILSLQYGKEYDYKNYGTVKKSISIWILPKCSEQMDGVIRRYAIQEKLISRNQRNDKKDYDKIEVLEIYTRDSHPVEEEYEKWDALLMPLNILLNNKLSAKEKKEVLKNKYNFQFSEQEQQEVEQMWNYAAIVRQEGKQEGKLEERMEIISTFLKKCIRNKMSLEEIQQEANFYLDLSKSQVNYYLSLLNIEIQ